MSAPRAPDADTISRSALKQLLDELTRIVINEKISLKLRDEKDDSGGFSDVFFTQHDTRVTKRETGKKTAVEKQLHVALIKPKEEDRQDDNTAFVNNIHRVEKLFSLKKIASPFIGQYMYVDASGQKITRRSEQNLMSFITQKENKLDANTCLSMIGQLILAVEVLHENNLVHRDLSPNNILVDPHKDFISLRLIDHDEVEEVGANNFPVREKIQPMVKVDYADPLLVFDYYRQGCSDEELQRITSYIDKYYKLDVLSPERQSINFTAEQAEIYDSILFQRERKGITAPIQNPSKLNLQQIDMKKIDIFALGRTIELVFLKNKYQMATLYNLLDLIRNLLNPDFRNRWTIQQAKESLLFGETPEARAKFFKNLEEEAQRFTVFSEDNLHQLLGDELWRMYAAVQQIDGLIHAGDISKDSAEAIKTTINFLANDLNKMITEYKGPAEIKVVLMKIEKNIFREIEEQIKISAEKKDNVQDEQLEILFFKFD